MRLLASTSDVLKLTTVGATEAIDVSVDYVDKDGSTITPGRTVTAQIVAAQSLGTICAAPTGTAIRNIKSISISNRNVSASVTISVFRYDGTTNSLIYPTFALPAGYSLVYEDIGGWTLFDASGGAVVTPLTGRFLLRTYILNGTTAFVTGPQTNTIIARMLAGGGQGGGSPATTGVEGAGGGAGSYAEWKVAVSPNTSYVCAVGAGGSTSGTNATGQTGGITTLAVGGTTATCNGGVGGPVGTSIAVPVLGGAGGAISTNATLVIPGASGFPPMCTGTALNNASGAGACSQLGNGGAAKVNAANTTGSAAGGYGAGGGGSVSTGTAQAGGAGSPGIIIIDEYS